MGIIHLSVYSQKHFSHYKRKTFIEHPRYQNSRGENREKKELNERKDTKCTKETV